MFIQVVRGLKSLHDIKIFHRDLKSANIFLNSDGTALLGDMNVSKVAKKGCYIPRPVLHTTPLQRFGEISLMITKVTSGPWGACSTNR